MKTILIPTDFSVYANQAVRIGVQLAVKTGAKIILLHHIDTLLKWTAISRPEQQEYPETLGRVVEAEIKLDKLVNSRLFAAVDVRKMMTYGVLRDEVIAKAKQYKADLILMGSHGNDSSGRGFIGSNFQKVMRQSEVPVLTVKKDYAVRSWKKAVFAASFDEDLHQAFRQLKNIFADLHTTVHLLFVNTPASFKDSRTVNDQMDAFIARYPEIKFEKMIWHQHNLDAGILEYAEAIKADWIAMATHRHMHSPAYLISVTESVTYHARQPVLSVLIER